MFALVLVDHFRRLLAVQRVDEAVAAAVESIPTFRQAAAAGIDRVAVAAQLKQLSAELTNADRPAEAADATQAAVDIRT
jgi:hypothetical protein